MLRRMVPVTYLFVVLFDERTWANEFAFVLLVVRGLAPYSPDRRLSWREQHGRLELGMCFFVSGERVLQSLPWMWAEMSCFRSKTPTESSCRQCRPDRSSSASRGCVHVHVTAYRWVNFGSFAKACHGKSFYSGFLFFLEQQQAHKYNSLTKNQERTTLPSTTSDRQRARVKRKNVNQRRDEMARTWKHILRHEHFRAKNRFVGVFFERRFQPLSVGGFFSNQRESISRCPKSPFPSKTQNRQIARTSPLRLLCSVVVLQWGE